jgi:hypothetical protein
LQKTGSLLFKKKKKAMLPLLFLNNIDPVFWAQLSSGPYFGPDFFKVPDLQKISS